MVQVGTGASQGQAGSRRGPRKGLVNLSGAGPEHPVPSFLSCVCVWTSGSGTPGVSAVLPGTCQPAFHGEKAVSCLTFISLLAFHHFFKILLFRLCWIFIAEGFFLGTARVGATL